ncbi:MAG: ATP-dependent ligase [Microbacteriaceae bacterium]|jgi:hypothetical protein|nr:ATP-dependent ligase [Microbacteriaceae bacterium]HEV7956381.1 ATP-dependent DNA ligase [Marisediminicola sp.]
MGTFSYDNVLKAEFDDRVLAHLQIVIGAKLRRKESFYFSWKDDAQDGARTTIWMHPAVPLIYKYQDGRTPLINRLWVEALSAAANAAGGLHIVPEPDPDAQN